MYDPSMEGSRDVSGFILAGGKSTRMGRDKAFATFDGCTLLGRALDLARSVTSDVRVVGSREIFARFAPVVEDVFPDRGPLGGIHAALQASSAGLNFILAVDMPFVSLAFLQYLISEARTAADAAVVVPRRDGRWQPLCAVYRQKFADAAEAALLAGRNKIDPLFIAAETKVIDEVQMDRAGFPESIFRNLNTLEELEEQQRRG